MRPDTTATGEDHPRGVSGESNYGGYKSPRPGVVRPLLNGFFWLIDGSPNYLQVLGGRLVLV